MKARFSVPLTAAVFAFFAAVLEASVPVTGTMTYSQDFDSLGTASPPWTDNATIPGWYVQINNGTTPPGSARAADGNTVLSGLLNCGSAGAPDRALGSKATGTGNLANISYAVSFQNTSTNPLQWTGLHYSGECWLTNSTTGNGTAESFTTFYQVSPAAVTSILSGSGSNVAAAGAGFTALGTSGNWTSPVLLPAATAVDGNADGNHAPVSHTPPDAVIVQPGHFLTIKWTDTNLGNTDGFQAIDDVTVEFLELAGSIVATASERARDFNGTPAILTDDTFGFTALIEGSGSVSSWLASGVNPPLGNTPVGSYGIPVVWNGFSPDGPKNVTIADAITPAFSASLTVPPLAVIGANDLVTPDTPILHEDVFFTGWVATDATRTLTQTISTPGSPQFDYVVNSEIIDLTTTGFLQFKANLTAKTGGSSGFETADRFTLQLILDGGTPISVLGTADANNDGYLTGSGAGGGGGPELPGADITNGERPFSISYIVPDTTNTLQIRITGNSNSAAETYIVSGIKLVPPPPTVILSLAGPSKLDNKGTVIADDDTFATPVIVTPVTLGASPGWNSNSTPDTGPYSPPAVDFGPFLLSGGAQTVEVEDQLLPVSAQITLPVPPPAAITVSAPANVIRLINGPGHTDDTVTFRVMVTGVSTGPSWNVTGAAPFSGSYSPGVTTLTIPAPLPPAPASIIFTDASYPAATQTVSVAFPSVYTFGQTGFGGLLPLFSQIVAPPDTAWVNDPAARTLTMNDGDAAGAGNRTVTSEVVNLSTIDGPVLFSANLHVRDLTSGFEPADNFNAWLIYDGNTGSPVSLIGPHDRDASGTLTGAELCPTPPQNTIQDFDYALSAIIPDNVTSVQFVITGLNDSTNETMIVSSVLFAPVPPTNDNDGDGVTNTDEELMGTDPDDPHSVLRLTQNAGNPLQLDFTTVSGRYYRAYVSDDAVPSAHLQSWKDAGLGTITGNGGPASFPITVAPGQARRYYRLHVMQTDGMWPPVVPVP
jgi:hypothetical protein